MEKIQFKYFENFNKFIDKHFNNSQNKKKKKIIIPKKIFNSPPKKNLVRMKNNNININNFQIYKFRLNTNNANDINNSSSRNKINNLPDPLKDEKGKNIFEKISSNIPNNKNEQFDDFELNNMEYINAIQSDKRNFINTYFSFLKRQHLIIFSFVTRDDHNIVYVKFSRLIFLACTDMALNVFFFSDETMHKMFLDYGKYNFVQQIPQVLYSSIVSNTIDVFLCFLSLTDKLYYEMKNKNKLNKYNAVRILKIVKLKIIFFYVFTFILFVFYLYTITSFCAVYQNTQNAFIKDSFLSLIVGYLYPFALYLIPTLLRIISLRYCNGKLSIIYKLSDIIPFF